MRDALSNGPRDGLREAIRGVLETVGVVCAFVGFGLGWAAVEGRTGEPYPAAVDANPEVERRDGGSDRPVWLVDGFNVLHAGLLGGRDRAGWWTAERRQEVLDAVARRRDAGVEVWVVFDGPSAAPEAPDAEPGPVRTVFAPSADDWLVARVRASARPDRTTVVTADRQVAERVRHRGARVVSPREFLTLGRAGAGDLG